MAALHEIGADLGDPVEIKRSEDRILVSGMGVAPRRQQDIQRALQGLPDVRVQFAEPPAMTAETPAGDTAEPAAPKTGTLQARLEKQLGGRAEMDRFTAQMLNWTEANTARAVALRALAQRFPANAEGAMSAADRARLSDLARDHTQFLTIRMNDLHRTLAPVLVSLGGGSPVGSAQGGPVSARSWQSEAEEVYRDSALVEKLLSELMGVNPEPADSTALPSRLLTALTDARAALADLQQEIR
jgi:hypothetical protein